MASGGGRLSLPSAPAGAVVAPEVVAGGVAGVVAAVVAGAVVVASVESSATLSPPQPGDPHEAEGEQNQQGHRHPGPHAISTSSSWICSPSGAPRLNRNARISGASRSAIDTMRYRVSGKNASSTSVRDG